MRGGRGRPHRLLDNARLPARKLHPGLGRRDELDRWTSVYAISFQSFVKLHIGRRMSPFSSVNSGNHRDRFPMLEENLQSDASDELQAEAASDLLARLLPEVARKVRIVVNRGWRLEGARDMAKLFAAEGQDHLTIQASSGVAAAWGFHHYLKYLIKSTVLGLKVVSRFCEFCSCSCLLHIPALLCLQHSRNLWLAF